MPSVSITWHTQHDDRVCPICKAIDGYKWVFTDTVPDSLIHPQYGEVWNIAMGSLAHEHQLHRGSKYGLLSNCRCKTEGKVEDIKDLLDLLRNKIDELLGATEEALEEAPDYQKGSSRKTTFEDIGVDPAKYGLE